MSGYEPLLTSDLNEAIPSPYAASPSGKKRDRHVMFALEDDSDDDRPLRAYADDENAPRTPDQDFSSSRVAPALRSTLRSREAG